MNKDKKEKLKNLFLWFGLVLLLVVGVYFFVKTQSIVSVIVIGLSCFVSGIFVDKYWGN